MLKSCAYCGRIHDSKLDCGKKPKKYRGKKKTDIDRLRSTSRWRDTRDRVKRRDMYLCQVCARKIYDIGTYQYNSSDLEVHHAIKLEQDIRKGYDTDNLITLCRTHHEMAESGEIPYKIIKDIIDEQQGRENDNV